MATLTIQTQFGETVELRDKQWAHILDGHPELTQDAITETVRRPDEVRYSTVPNHQTRQLYIRMAPSNAFAGQYVKVVVEFANAPAWVVTAVAQKELSPADTKGALRID